MYKIVITFKDDTLVCFEVDDASEIVDAFSRRARCIIDMPGEISGIDFGEARSFSSKRIVDHIDDHVML